MTYANDITWVDEPTQKELRDLSDRKSEIEKYCTRIAKIVAYTTVASVFLTTDKEKLIPKLNLTKRFLDHRLNVKNQSLCDSLQSRWKDAFAKVDAIANLPAPSTEVASSSVPTEGTNATGEEKPAADKPSRTKLRRLNQTKM